MAEDNLEKLYIDGLRAYAAQDYYEAHEIWEDLWRNKAIPDRKFIQGLIQLSASLFKAQQNAVRGARSLLEKAMEKFLMFETTVYEVDIPTIRLQCDGLMKAYGKSDDLSGLDFSFAPDLRKLN